MKENISYVACLDIGAWFTKLIVWLGPSANGDGSNPQTVHTVMCRSQGVGENLISNQSDIQGCIKTLLAEAEEKLQFRIEEVFVLYPKAGQECYEYQPDERCQQLDKTGSTVVSEKDLKTLDEHADNFNVSVGCEIFDIERQNYYINKSTTPVTQTVLGSYADYISCRYSIYAAPKSYIKKLKYAIESCGLRIIKIVASVRLLSNLLFNKNENRCEVILSVGANQMELGIFRNGLLVHNQITQHSDEYGICISQVLDKALKGLNEDRLEAVKRKMTFEPFLPVVDRAIPPQFCTKDKNGFPKSEMLIAASVLNIMLLAFEQIRLFGKSDLVDAFYIIGGGLAFSKVEEYLNGVKEIDSRFLQVPISLLSSFDQRYTLEACTPQQGQSDPIFYSSCLALLEYVRREKTYSSFHEILVDSQQDSTENLKEEDVSSPEEVAVVQEAPTEDAVDPSIVGKLVRGTKSVFKQIKQSFLDNSSSDDSSYTD